jgi:hypothetical protein
MAEANEITFALNALKSGEMFFFAGSGISYESNLPSANDVLVHSANTFLPENISEEEKGEICTDIQPEVFYESIIGMTGSYECLDIWRSLHRGEQKKHYIECRPNLVHLFIVEYSNKHRLPVVTTNFDSMFEQACEILDIEYRVLLPTDSPPDKSSCALSICKLHGSIENCTGEYSPKTLWTTMTQITKINTGWIEYIWDVMLRTHICFVGYSGRDIDLFPYLAEAPQMYGTKRIIWINRFEGDNSDSASKACGAIRVNLWPSEFLKETDRSSSISIPVSGHSETKSSVEIKKLLFSVEQSLTEKELLTDVEKRLLHCMLLAKLGKYRTAYVSATELLNTGALQHMTGSNKNLLLLTCARLSHENSQYESCKTYAKQLLRSFQKGKFDINAVIQANCLVSESLRMSITGDIYFQRPREISDYLYVAFVILHFIKTVVISNLTRVHKKTQFSELNIDTQHELIEHQVRFYALLQSILGSPQKGWSNLAKRFLFHKWEKIKSLSYRTGYAAGIANCGKFSYRLQPNIITSSKSEYIYKLLTSATGAELLVRNEAERLLQEEKYDEAREKFIEYSEMAQSSGNTLNEIKGIIGQAYVNRIQQRLPLLSKEREHRFSLLIASVEGKRWQHHLQFIKRIITTNET